jgi:hypothetical protein
VPDPDEIERVRQALQLTKPPLLALERQLPGGITPERVLAELPSLLGIGRPLRRIAGQLIQLRDVRALHPDPLRRFRREAVSRGGVQALLIDPVRAMAHEILARLLLSQHDRLPKPRELYLTLAEAVQDTLQEKIQALPLPENQPAGSGETVEATASTTMQEAWNAGATRVGQVLSELHSDNGPDFLAPYRLYYFAGRTIGEVALLLEQEESWVTNRLEFIERAIRPDPQEWQAVQQS